ncbi:MAG: helix-turn-helix transcriptional regulator [Floccifex porci]|uniref:helix-turn-helix transcriptional regulator n=1 Tax=Floccifex porci TaxID=2606629 RepID=UPI003F0B2E93
MELQTQIRKYRKTLNLSQEELAEKIYVTRQTISNWKMEKAIRIFTVLFFLVLYSASL